MYACAFVTPLLLVYQLFEGLAELAIYFAILNTNLVNLKNKNTE